MTDEHRETQAIWKRIDQTRSDIDSMKTQQAIIENRITRVEDTQAKIMQQLTDIQGSINSLRSEIQQGRVVIRVLLWAGGVIGTVAAFAAWAWVELKKMSL